MEITRSLSVSCGAKLSRTLLTADSVGMGYEGKVSVRSADSSLTKVVLTGACLEGGGGKSGLTQFFRLIGVLRPVYCKKIYVS